MTKRRRKALSFSLLEPRLMLAADIFVNMTVDENDGIDIGGVSLREAVQHAERAEVNRILFADNLQDQTILLDAAFGALEINDDLTIDGQGKNVSIRSEDVTHVFKITGGDVTIENLTLPTVVIESSSTTKLGGTVVGDLINNGTLAVASGGTHQDENSFYFQDQKVPITFSADQLGIVVQENVSERQLKEVLANFDLDIVQEHENSLFVIQLENPLPRQELVRIAGEIKTAGRPLVAQAGLVGSLKNDELPTILSDEFIAGFAEGTSKEEINALNATNNVQVVMENPFDKNQFLLRVAETSQIDSVTMANRYREFSQTDYSYPNFIGVYVDQDHDPPNDTLFGNQWHHLNSGQGGGTVDADSDTAMAWHITEGTADIVIAVLENGGFDMSHADLTPNFWVNPGEIAGNGIDDDASGFVDDINGWDFGGCAAPAVAGCGDNDPSPATATEDHGTAVAGVAAARGNNALGVTGSCPNCQMMLLRTGYVASDWAKSLAFGYAQQMGARIITNSWGGASATPNTVAAINNAAAAGVVVLFAAGNTPNNVCGPFNPDPRVSLPGVIAVSSSSNQDRKVIVSATGNCIDILAPSHRGYSAAEPYTGTLNITTTDRTGTAGYNNTNPVGNCPTAESGPPPANARDYTDCFGGTSSATPLTAGIVGLMLSADPTLTRIQVQRLLQDTADKIEDSVGAYATANGFSNPAAGVPTHSYGRINAMESVEIVAPVAQGGKEGVDIFVRDNRLDWGNTEQPSNTLFEPTRGFIPHWRSEDIKVDAPPYQPAPATGAAFETFIDETPSAMPGDVNRVYVRARNRGPVTASSLNVKLHWTQFGTALPALPGDFWTAFPADSADTTQWHPLDCTGTTSSVCTMTNLAYSGSSVANTAADAAQIVSFDFPAPAIDPSLANHFCLTAMIESPQDPISPSSKGMFIVDNITPNDNNVTHRNYHNLSDSNSQNSSRSFFVRNPTDSTIETVLKLKAADRWTVKLDKFEFGKVFVLQPHEEVLVSIVDIQQINDKQTNDGGEFSIVQERADGNRLSVMGGVTFQWMKSSGLPDLEVVSFATPTETIVDQPIGNLIQLEIRNNGPGAVEPNSSLSIGFYISSDNEITSADQLLVGGREFLSSGLASGETKLISLADSASIGSDVEAGQQFIGVLIDEFDKVVETNETNNTAAQPIILLSERELEVRRNRIRKHFDERLAELRSVATTSTESGQIIDWISPKSQTSDGTIATPPDQLGSTEPNSNATDPMVVDPPIRSKDLSAQTEVQIQQQAQGPPGTVPVVRFDVEAYLESVKIPPENPLNVLAKLPVPAPAANDRYYAVWQRFGTFYGSTGRINIWDVAGPVAGETSIAQVAVIGGTPMQAIEAGKMEFPGVNRGRPYFFTYFRTAGGAQGDWIGGYHNAVEGWIQVSPTVAPGMSLAAWESTENGDQYSLDVKVRLWQGNWWVWAAGDWAGYYPFCQGGDSAPCDTGTLFSAAGIRDQATRLDWYGEVFDSSAPAPTSTDMGSGNFAADWWQQAAYFRNLTFFWAPNTHWWWNSGTLIVTDSNCYSGLGPYYSLQDAWKNWFFYGGPGEEGPECI